MYIYSQSTGILKRETGGESTVVGTGYAGGDCGDNPGGVNNPAMQQIHNVGPLPQGLYCIGVPIDHTHLGPCAMPLTPNPSNVMFGRSGFFIHADTIAQNRSASEGCIVMPGPARTQIAALLGIDNYLTVTA
jgi:hypothetical protein